MDKLIPTFDSMGTQLHSIQGGDGAEIESTIDVQDGVNRSRVKREIYVPLESTKWGSGSSNNVDLWTRRHCNSINGDCW